MDKTKTSPTNSAESSSSKSSSQNSKISSTFKSLVEKHQSPVDYNIFATSYICQEIPENKGNLRGSDDAESEITVQFSSPVLLKELEIKERADLRLLKSARTKHIIPNTKEVLRQIYRSALKSDNPEKRIEFLYYKAKQWCEVNKAIVLDQRFPKPPKKLMVQRSSFQRKAVRDFMAEQKVAEKPETPNLSINDDTKLRQDRDDSLCNSILEILGPPQPLRTPSELLEVPWQLKASETANKKIRPNKKCPWKRNVYPPKSEEMRIQELRELLPSPKPPHLETDQLSGIWDPVLMISEFQITGPDYDSRAAEEPLVCRPIDWYQLQSVKQKCSEWLSAEENRF